MDAAELVASYLEDVSNEPDADRRRDAIERLFHEDVRYADQDGPVNGREALAERISVLAALMGPTARFSLRRPAQGVDDAVIFQWRLGAPTEDPDLEGTDVALIRDGRIARLYAVLD